jgi:hypothetical protein
MFLMSATFVRHDALPFGDSIHQRIQPPALSLPVLNHRMGRNPATGEALKIKASKKVGTESSNLIFEIRGGDLTELGGLDLVPRLRGMLAPVASSPRNFAS